MLLSENLKTHLQKRGPIKNAYKTKKVWHEVLELIKPYWDEHARSPKQQEAELDFINNVVNLMISKEGLNQKKDAFKHWAAYNIKKGQYPKIKFTWDGTK